MDGRIGRGEFVEALAAAAARGAQAVAVADDDDLDDFAGARGDHRADGRRLRALALRVGRVFDIGAGMQAAVIGAQTGADLKWE